MMDLTTPSTAHRRAERDLHALLLPWGHLPMWDAAYLMDKTRYNDFLRQQVRLATHALPGSTGEPMRAGAKWSSPLHGPGALPRLFAAGAGDVGPGPASLGSVPRGGRGLWTSRALRMTAKPPGWA